MKVIYIFNALASGILTKDFSLADQCIFLFLQITKLVISMSSWFTEEESQVELQVPASRSSVIDEFP